MEVKILTPTDEQLVSLIDAWAKSDFESGQNAAMNDQIAVLGLNRPKVVVGELSKILKENSVSNSLSPQAKNNIQTTVNYINSYLNGFK